MTINVIQPKHGRIDVISAAQNAYTVQYVPPVGVQVDFKGFKVYCHACEEYVERTAQTVATFDFDYLASHGHPGPFDISADVTAGISFLVMTRPADANMGSTTPVEEWIDGAEGETVSYTIKATPKDGYEFVKWVSSTGAEFTRASQTISVTLDYDADYREYVAYFRPKTVEVYVLRKRGNDVAGSLDRRLTQDSTVSSIEGPRTVYYTPPGESQVAVAVVYSNIISAQVGSDVTLRVEMLPAASTYGVRFLAWRCTDDRIYQCGYDLNFVLHVGPGNMHVNAYFSVDAVRVRIEVNSKLYGYVLDYYAGVVVDRGPSIFPDGEICDYGLRTYIVLLVPKNTRFSFELNLWRYAGSAVEGHMTFAAENAFVHGASSDRFEPPDLQYGSTVAYFTSGNEDETLEIYLCTHLLVHKPDGQNLESKPPQLLYDCNAPEQSQQS